MKELLDAVRRHAETLVQDEVIIPTAIPGMNLARSLYTSDLIHAVAQPHVVIVVQGAKTVTMGAQTFAFSAGETLLVAADVPTTSQIVRASPAAPYYSLVLQLDAAIVAELSAEIDAVAVGSTAESPVRVDTTEREVADAALRLLRLLDRPAAAPVLQAQLLREMHYWLLAGHHGNAIRLLGLPDGHVQRIARAVAVLRADYARALPVERLAAVAGMSPSSFHQHFRTVTSLSPLQFQKQLRLIEARRLMLARGLSSSHAAFEVGYESVPQFTREYGRFFGLSPARDVKAAKERLAA
ncbi:AraC family transcriptional regulator [Novosphingobium sp. JCM 18896]|uniref:AraC family transcriptional regulator n=1 Tax=Novosphingobium sp. JCM 18896 TaxID=2989731 RepID=UPI002221C0A7|nr:AraC family transcriptional regulator [Novosphingobium sp. JCM 18896]MCW1428806.1 AraC family transcriptional regulator [Novosphingobium sp. JCM 18896]